MLAGALANVPPNGELRVRSLAEQRSGVHRLPNTSPRGFKVCYCSSNQVVCQECVAYGVEAVADFVSLAGVAL